MYGSRRASVCIWAQLCMNYYSVTLLTHRALNRGWLFSAAFLTLAEPGSARQGLKLEQECLDSQ